MGWEEMQQLATLLFVDEIAAVQRDGGEALLRSGSRRSATGNAACCAKRSPSTRTAR
jgi:hypothetical protein